MKTDDGLMTQPHQSAYWWTRRGSLLERYEAERPGLDEALAVLRRSLGDILTSNEIRGTVRARVKKFDDFYRKLLERSREAPIEDPFTVITDMLGLRVVTPFVQDMRRVSELIRQHFEVTEIDDKSSALSISEFGYDSMHLLITLPEKLGTTATAMVAEIQLRTTLQDAWAEVEHELVYKTRLDPLDDRVDAGMRRKLIALNATLSLADTIFQEIRDYQQRRYAEVHARHQKLMAKVATIPERIGREHEPIQLEAQQEADQDKPPLEVPQPDSPLSEVLVRALEAHLAMDLEEAVTLYSEVLAVTPAAHIFNHRGIAHLALADYKHAIEDFTEAIRRIPSEPQAYTNRGLALRMAGRLDEALADFDHSFELQPMWPDTLYGRALTHFDLGNVPAALRDCDRAIALKPNFKSVIRFKRYIQDADL